MNFSFFKMVDEVVVATSSGKSSCTKAKTTFFRERNKKIDFPLE